MPVMETPPQISKNVSMTMMGSHTESIGRPRDIAFISLIPWVNGSKSDAPTIMPMLNVVPPGAKPIRRKFSMCTRIQIKISIWRMFQTLWQKNKSESGIYSALCYTKKIRRMERLNETNFFGRG